MFGLRVQLRAEQNIQVWLADYFKVDIVGVTSPTPNLPTALLPKKCLIYPCTPSLKNPLIWNGPAGQLIVRILLG
jgi:hypothetical protein